MQLNRENAASLSHTKTSALAIRLPLNEALKSVKNKYEGVPL